MLVSSLEKRFIQLPVYRRFRDCEKSSTCFLDELRLFVRVYAKQVLNPWSNIRSRKEVVEKSKIFLVEITTHMPKKKADSWTVSAGLLPLQTFKENICSSLLKCKKMKCYLETTATAFFCDGLKSTANVSTSLLCERSSRWKSWPKKSSIKY